MIALILILLLIALGLAAVLTIGAGWFQAYYYERTVDGLAWRGPAAAGVLALFLVIWSVLEYRWPGRFDSPFNLTVPDEQLFERFWSEKKTEQGTREVPYSQRRTLQGQIEYVDPDGRPWRRSDSGMMTAIIVEENEQRKRFVAQLDKDGNFPRDPRDPTRVAEVRYMEDGGQCRVMTENAIGRISTTRTGMLLGNLLFHAVHFAVWFLALWLLLQLQWPHALALAALMWLVTVLMIWPGLSGRVPALRTAAPPVAVGVEAAQG